MAIILLLVLALAVAILLTACLRQAAAEQVEFSKQPCLTDEEFCALMPDVPDHVALGVREALADATGWDREEIHPKTRLIEFDLW